MPLNQSSTLLLEGDEEGKPLSERLKLAAGETFDPIPCQLLRKYVGYARKYVHPRLSQEGANVLQRFYLDLRRHRQSPDSTPITTRQLESLIRLTEVSTCLVFDDCLYGGSFENAHQNGRLSFTVTFIT